LGTLVGHRRFESLLSRRWGTELYNLLKRNNFLAYYATTYRIFNVLEAAELLSSQLRRSAGAGQLSLKDLREIDELAEGTAVNRVSGLCLRGYTKNQLLRDMDAVSMAHSLEVRFPFLDVPLIDLALSLPVTTKLGKAESITNPARATYRESGSKKILIDAGLRLGLLPPDIDCQPKRGFSLPFDCWLKGPLHDILEDTLSARSINNRGFFKAEAVDRVKQAFIADEVHWTRPWLLVVIELWCRALLDSVLVG
jgi:asparagine synthase (glutamine-hydrolysing)